MCIHGRNRHSSCMMCSGLSIRFFVYFAYVVSDLLNQSQQAGRKRRQAHAGTLGLGQGTDSGKGHVAFHHGVHPISIFIAATNRDVRYRADHRDSYRILPRIPT